MEEGAILQWLKQVGDELAVGDELVEIETDKANMAYESDTAGTLIEILAEVGQTLPIGAVIARVGDQGEAPGGEPRARKLPQWSLPRPTMRPSPQPNPSHLGQGRRPLHWRGGSPVKWVWISPRCRGLGPGVAS